MRSLLLPLLASAAVLLAGADPAPEPMPEPAPEPMADPIDLDPEDAGCGPPHMFPNWSNRTVAAGESLMLTCPLDTKNSCIIDFVEWYFSTSDPRSTPTGRSLLRDAAVPFDPLMAHFPAMEGRQTGWYTCIVGNSEGRSKSSVYVRVTGVAVARPQQPPPASSGSSPAPSPVAWRERQAAARREHEERVRVRMDRERARQTQELRGRNYQQQNNNNNQQQQQQGRNENVEQIVYSRYRGHRGFQPSSPSSTPSPTAAPAVPTRSAAIPAPTPPAPEALMRRPVSVVVGGRKRPQTRNLRLRNRQQHQQQQQQLVAGGAGGHTRSQQLQQPATAQATEVEALHQHLRYIYDRIDEMSGTMESLQRRVARLEAESSSEEEEQGL